MNNLSGKIYYIYLTFINHPEIFIIDIFFLYKVEQQQWKATANLYFLSADVTAASQADIEPCGELRICLVGSLADDAETLEAAQVSHENKRS